MRVYSDNTQDYEFQTLGSLGYAGNLNDRQYGYLGTLGLTGSLTDRFQQLFLSGAQDYKANGHIPSYVVDFSSDEYVVGTKDSTFDNALTATGASLKTMTDSDGLLKWAPHNLVLNSATPATQSISVVSGADYTVECTGVSIALSGAGSGAVTEGNPVTITASTTTLTLTVTGSTGTMWAYRSDLGGMVDNPDRGDSYVPTTSAAVYLPRLGHHVYDGSSWVNKGLLHESESRTNLVTYSEDFTDASWLTGGLSSVVSSDTSISPDGNTNAETLSVDSVGGATGTVGVAKAITVSTSTAYTASVFAKADQSDFLALGVVALTTPANGNVWFDLVNGTVGTSDTGLSGAIKDFGDGWYRCSITFTTDAADTSGQLRIYLGNTDGGSTINRDGTSSILIYGAQLEEGSTPSSYIPTSGSTVTRSAETLTVPAANLPWPTPVVIGEELVTNGTFDSDYVGWDDANVTANAGTVSVSGGQVVVTRGTARAEFYQIVTTEVGKVYTFNGSVVSKTGTVSIWLGTTRNNASNLNKSNVSVGSVSGQFVATSTSTYVTLVVDGAEGTNGVFDNISVKEINPLSVSIQMQGEMTYADEGGVDTPRFFNWLLDGNNYILARNSSSGANTGQPIFAQVSGGTYDAVAGSTAYFSPGVNVPFNIASRHGSTFINGAVDGTALTADTTPVALPDLSATDLQLGYDYMGTISLFRIWADDLGDTGIAEASS